MSAWCPKYQIRQQLQPAWDGWGKTLTWTLWEEVGQEDGKYKGFRKTRPRPGWLVGNSDTAVALVGMHRLPQGDSTKQQVWCHKVIVSHTTRWWTVTSWPTTVYNGTRPAWPSSACFWTPAECFCEACRLCYGAARSCSQCPSPQHNQCFSGPD